MCANSDMRFQWTSCSNRERSLLEKCQNQTQPDSCWTDDKALILLEVILPTWNKNVASVKRKIIKGWRETICNSNKIQAKSQGFILRWSQSKSIQQMRYFSLDYCRGPCSCSFILQQLSCWTDTGDKSSPWTLTAGVRTGAVVSPQRQTVTCHRSQQRTSTQDQSANGAWRGRKSEWWSWGRGLIGMKMCLNPWFIPSSWWSMLIPAIHTAWSVYRSGF